MQEGWCWDLGGRKRGSGKEPGDADFFVYMHFIF